MECGMVGCLVGWLGWLVGRSVAWLVGLVSSGRVWKSNVERASPVRADFRMC